MCAVTRRAVRSDSPHPLAEQLPAIMRASLDATEAQCLRGRGEGLDDAALAERLGLAVDDVARTEATAWAKLGLRAASPSAAAIRASQDDFLERMLGALDEVLVPVLETLDSLEVYVDPALAPDSALAWLGRWVGLRGRETWTERSWRRLVAEATDLYRRRGTAGAVRRIVELYTEGEVEVVDPGGSALLEPGETARPGAPAPVPVVVVRVRGGRISPSVPGDMAGLAAVVRSIVPAHLAHRVEVTA